jgi:hypothetical protein
VPVKALMCVLINHCTISVEDQRHREIFDKLASLIMHENRVNCDVATSEMAM